MSPDFQSLCYLAAWDREQPPEGGLAWASQLRRCRLDYSWASLARIDLFLDALRAQRRPRADAFLSEQANVNLLLTLAFYVVELRARVGGVHGRLLGFDEAVARDPAVKTHGQGFHSLLIAEHGTTRFLPLVSICERLFEEAPTKSVAFSAGVFLEAPDDPRRCLPPLAVPSMIPDCFARYEGKRIPAGVRRMQAMVDGFEGFDAADPLRRLERDGPVLLREGRVVWAALVQANTALSDPSRPITAPAELVYDPQGRTSREDLCRIAERLMQAKRMAGDPVAANPLPADAPLTQYAAHLRAETTRAFGWRVPLYPYPVLASTTLVSAEAHLPGYALVDRALPVLVSDACPGSVVVAPWQVWPEDVYDAWCARSRAVHGPKARIPSQPADGNAVDGRTVAAPSPTCAPEPAAQATLWCEAAAVMLQAGEALPAVRARLGVLGCPPDQHARVIEAAQAMNPGARSGPARSRGRGLVIIVVIVLILAASRVLIKGLG